MERIMIQDLMGIRFIHGVSLSPDSAYTAYVLTKQNDKENSYESWIHCMDNRTGESRQLTYTGKENAFVWEDSHTILFPAQRGEADKAEEFKQKTSYYRLDIRGGEAYKAFEINVNVADIKPLAHGKYLLNAIVNLNALGDDVDEQLRRDEKDFHVLEEIPFWSNGKGYISRIRSALYLYDAKDASLQKITTEYFNVSAFDAKDQKVAYIGCAYQDKYSVYGAAKLYDIPTGETSDMIEPGTFGVNDVALTGNGAILALSTFEPYGLCQAADLHRYDFAAKTLSLAFDGMQIGSAMVTDVAYGRHNRMKTAGNDVYFIGQQGFRTTLYRLDAEHAPHELFPFTGDIQCFDIVGDTVVFVGREPNCCSDLYRVESGVAVRKTDINAAFFAEKQESKAKHIPFTNSDGVTIDGWVLEPFGHDPETKYPGVLEIHGGPRNTYGELFHHEMQMLAGAGFFVFFCNPRGSEGYGEEFADLRGKYGTVDYRDLMEFTDHILYLYPQIDKARLACAGGSYGGFMCNWIAGHTDRFAAIASQRSISNWIADFGASEIGFTFDMNEMGANPWTDVEKMWEQSPLKYASNAKTPTLFIHSLGDYNCTIDQGVEMFTAMKFFGVPSRMCIFEEENHELSRSGKPRRRIRRLTEILSWFEKYLKPDARE